MPEAKEKQSRRGRVCRREERTLDLPKESKERLEAVRPENIGQLSRIPGIRPSDVSIVSIYVYTMTKNNEENKESEN